MQGKVIIERSCCSITMVNESRATKYLKSNEIPVSFVRIITCEFTRKILNAQ